MSAGVSEGRGTRDGVLEGCEMPTVVLGMDLVTRRAESALSCTAIFQAPQLFTLINT